MKPFFTVFFSAVRTHTVRVLGENPASVIGQAAVIVDQQIYLFGGYNGIGHNALLALSLPGDLCRLVHDPFQCLEMIGCSACVVPHPVTGVNITYCYASDTTMR